MSPDRPRERLRAVIRGTVQGVGFRWFVQRTAARLELQGWVANRADGSVEVVAEGSPEDIEHLLAALQGGSPSSSVSAVEVHRGPALGGLGAFVIKSGSHPGD
jgi:acylphosphatase